MENQKQAANSKGNEGGNNPSNGKLHIFINNIKYDEKDGVKDPMTGAELAAMVPIDPEKADITRKNSTEKISSTQVVPIHIGDHFEIIRKQVLAG
jgi:hypothetical protein